MEEVKDNEFRQFVVRWNILYPIDKWWRDKHKVPFGSQAHRQQNVIDMRIEYEEDFMYLQYDRDRQQKETVGKLYKPGMGIWLMKQQPIKPTQQQIDRDFDNINIDAINKSKSKVVHGKKRYRF